MTSLTNSNSDEPGRENSSQDLTRANPDPDLEVTEGSNNVFRDLGFSDEEAENLRIRSQLMISIKRYIKDQGWTQKEAAEHLGETQPRISELVNGKIGRFSIDKLIDMHAKAGLRVEVSVFSGEAR